MVAVGEGNLKVAADFYLWTFFNLCFNEKILTINPGLNGNVDKLK